MRLRNAPYTEFKRVSITLDDFSSVACFPSLMINNMPVMDMELKENDLISFMNPACPLVLPKGCQETEPAREHWRMGSYSGCRSTSALSADTHLLQGLPIMVMENIFQMT